MENMAPEVWDDSRFMIMNEDYQGGRRRDPGTSQGHRKEMHESSMRPADPEEEYCEPYSEAYDDYEGLGEIDWFDIELPSRPEESDSEEELYMEEDVGYCLRRSPWYLKEELVGSKWLCDNPGGG